MITNHHRRRRAHVPLLAEEEETRGEQSRPHTGRRRGFASMSPERVREIASKGGKAAHAQGTAHTFSPEEAQAAGRKGGHISRRRPKSA